MIKMSSQNRGATPDSLDEFFAKATPEEMPTIIALNERKKHNIFGSRTNTGGTYNITYEDGSNILVDDSDKWLCFFTKEGYQEMPKQRMEDIVAFICGKHPNSSYYQTLGSGNYSDVYRYGLPSEGPYVIIKGTLYDNMQRREMQLNAWGKYKPEESDHKGRIEAMDTSLVTSWRLIDKLRKNGVHVPSLYAFAINLQPRYNLGSFEMMEYIPGWTLERCMDHNKNGGFGMTNNHPDAIQKALQHFSSANDIMSQIYHDCYALKEQAEAVEPDIGDIRPENLIITDFKTETKKFDVVLIDPVKIWYKGEKR